MNPYQELKLVSRSVGTGVTQGGLLCPFCRGGRLEERSLRVHRREDGLVLFICFRASCGKHGRMFTNGNVVANEGETPQQKAWEPRRYTGETRRLNDEERAFLWATYGLNNDDIRRHRLAIDAGSGRLVVPIMGTDGKTRGHELRLLGKSGNDKDGPPKTLHYRALDEPWMGWFANGREFTTERPVVLVEDVLSAMKVAHQYVAVSLMGSHLRKEDLFEVTKLTDNIVLALDKDATEKALSFQKKYKFLCPTLQVLILQKDLKYSSDGEIGALVRGDS